LLRKNGIALSDRRVVKIQKLVAAAGAIAGRTQPSESDLWPIVGAVPSRDGQSAAREVLKDILAKAESEALAAAALEASLGPLARAQRIVAAGQSLLAARPVDDDRAVESWRLKLEGVAREIDAGFGGQSMPPAVSSVRAQIVSVVGAQTTTDEAAPATK